IVPKVPVVEPLTLKSGIAAPRSPVNNCGKLTGGDTSLPAPTPDGVMLEPGVIYTVIALMFLYTFVGICAGFGGGLTTMPLIT
ncbi:hypothetical protein ONQ97_27900, partial [Salmonella enterica subsp. enterica serovar Virginia]|nr:hypothetical protein [Salmonella enterica subsp. enterica serovar Virginia]